MLSTASAGAASRAAAKRSSCVASPLPIPSKGLGYRVNTTGALIMMLLASAVDRLEARAPRSCPRAASIAAVVPKA